MFKWLQGCRSENFHDRMLKSIKPADIQDSRSGCNQLVGGGTTASTE